MLTPTASELSILDKFTAEATFAGDPDVQASHINVATDILKFCVAAAKLFFNHKGKERSGLGLALKAQWKGLFQRHHKGIQATHGRDGKCRQKGLSS